ncbi:MAG: ABC transporter ATP-binding protein [Chloroflexota bacterium]
MALLELNGLYAGYGEISVLRDVSIKVEEGQFTSIVGSNGAGKTTLMRTISGLMKPKRGEIRFQGKVISGIDDYKIVELGLIQVPENRQLFFDMTVLENLEMGSFTKEARRHRGRSLEIVFDLFPVLSERKNQVSKTLSGGEQQMLAVGRALMSMPKMLMLDEPSLGLAPVAVQRLFSAVQEINKRGTTVLLVEQNVQKALSMCDHAYVLENGCVVMEGVGKDLLDRPELRTAYLGV